MRGELEEISIELLIEILHIDHPLTLQNWSQHRLLYLILISARSSIFIIFPVIFVTLLNYLLTLITFFPENGCN